METVTIKMEGSLAKTIEKTMKAHHYTTKTEFIREAIRDKIESLEDRDILHERLVEIFGASAAGVPRSAKNLTKEEQLARLKKVYGAGKHHKTTDAQLHEAGERAFEDLERELQGSSSGRKE